MSFTDDVADVLGSALCEVAELYRREHSRPPSSSELGGLLDLILGANPEQYLDDGSSIEVSSVTINTSPRTGVRELQVGDVIKARLRDGQWVHARVFGISEGHGTVLGVYDTRHMDEQDIDWRTRPFCLKEHHVVESSIDDKSTWQFVRATTIGPEDSRPIPQRRPSIGGIDFLVEAANYYYDLMDEPPSRYLRARFA